MLVLFSKILVFKNSGLKTNLLIEVDRPVAESDAITEAVLSCGTAKLPIKPDILAFGMGVKAG